MLYCIYGQTQGLQAMTDAKYYAVVSASDVVVDVSTSAQKRGVREGIRKKTAQALIPEIEFLAEPMLPPPIVKLLWAGLWKHSPWLETVRYQAFLLQIPAAPSSFREVRDIAEQINQQLTVEQRVRIGIAENPFLAQALVRWSYLERVPGAIYRKVGRQELVISPGICSVPDSTLQGFTDTTPKQQNRSVRSEKKVMSTEWIEKLPIQALWGISLPERTELLRLGIRRLGDLRTIPAQALMDRFGPAAILWLEYMRQFPGGKVNVNYPAFATTQTWNASIDDEVPIAKIHDVCRGLLLDLSRSLTIVNAGARNIRVQWCTERENREWTRQTKHPIYQADDLYAHVQSELATVQGECLISLEISVAEFCPLPSMQSTFDLRGDVFYPSRDVLRDSRDAICRQVNRRFPSRLQIGMKSSFRELRIQAIFQEMKM